MIMENDRLNIPEEYRKMSVAELEQEAKRVMTELSKQSSEKKEKKKAVNGKREIVFNF